MCPSVAVDVAVDVAVGDAAAEGNDGMATDEGPPAKSLSARVIDVRNRRRFVAAFSNPEVSHGLGGGIACARARVADRCWCVAPVGRSGC